MDTCGRYRLTILLLIVLTSCSLIGQRITGIVASSIHPVTYYVSNNGNDSDDGLTPSTSWKTIGANINWSSFDAGDKILFNRGDVWKEALIIPQGGTVGNSFVFSSYGTGALPIITTKDTIDGWGVAGNWTENGTNQWWYYTVDGDNPARVWLDDVHAHQVEDKVDLTDDGQWWFDAVNGYLYLYATSNPASYFSSVETAGVDNNSYTIRGTDKDYVTFSYLDIRGGRVASIRNGGCDHWLIKNCNIGRDGGYYGVWSKAYAYPNSADSCIVRNCYFDTGDTITHEWYAWNNGDGIQLEAGTNDWEIYSNTFINWTHNAVYFLAEQEPPYTVAGNKFYNNDVSAPDIDYGRGFGCDGKDDRALGNEIYNNYFHDLGVQSQINANGTKVYNNIFNDISNDKVPYATDGEAYGIHIRGYGEFEPINMQIHNNIFANMDEPGLCINDTLFEQETEVSQYNLIRNNIFFNCGINSLDGRDDYQLFLRDCSDNLDNTYQNNLFYKSGVTDLIYYGHDVADDYPKTVAEFNAENGTADDVIEDNIGGDPLFTNGSGTYTLASDFTLQAGSPAIDKGIGIIGNTFDYIGNPRDAVTPDIGAYEKQ